MTKEGGKDICTKKKRGEKIKTRENKKKRRQRKENEDFAKIFIQRGVKK